MDGGDFAATGYQAFGHDRIREAKDPHVTFRYLDHCGIVRNLCHRNFRPRKLTFDRVRSLIIPAHDIDADYRFASVMSEAKDKARFRFFGRFADLEILHRLSDRFVHLVTAWAASSEAT